jgi:hypothetical protein
MIVACPKSAAHAPTVVEQYELLRGAMLGAPLPPGSRTGLIVLLHRGMWAWARAIAGGATQQGRSRLPRSAYRIWMGPANGAPSSTCSPPWR